MQVGALTINTENIIIFNSQHMCNTCMRPWKGGGVPSFPRPFKYFESHIPEKNLANITKIHPKSESFVSPYP